jgi:hypothetical protein
MVSLQSNGNTRIGVLVRRLYILGLMIQQSMWWDHAFSKAIQRSKFIINIQAARQLLPR